MEDLNTRLKDDKEVVLAAVKKNLDDFKFASARLKEDQNIIDDILKYYNGYEYRLQNGLDGSPEFLKFKKGSFVWDSIRGCDKCQEYFKYCECFFGCYDCKQHLEKCVC